VRAEIGAPPPAPADAGRIPSLDGLRAISIGLVVFRHLCGTGHFLPERVGSFVEIGDLGVRVFFVISGFLITTLLLDELDASGRVHLGKFYLRRTFRIFPPYYAFLLAVLATSAAGWLALNPGDLMHAVTYTSNYHGERSWHVGHTWSLSVEEQFYLLWPAVLLLAGRRGALAAAAGLFMASPFIRLGLWWWGGPEIGIGHRFETVADAIAIGCVLAGSAAWLRRQPLYSRLLDSRLFALVPVVVLAASLLHDRPRLSFLFGFSIMNLGIAACLHWCVIHHEGRIGRVLNSGPLVYVGVLSYSIYLWQQVFLIRESAATLNQFPVNLLGVIAASVVSFYAIERPWLALRRRLERRWFAPITPSGASSRSTREAQPRPASGRFGEGHRDHGAGRLAEDRTGWSAPPENA
jgi:peptidoglycan/LPS O-acetylase OafA/YrhL